jgi:head-tail adaptor
MTHAGQLDRRVYLQQRAETANGVRDGDWTTMVTRDARIQPLKGGETVQAERLAGRQPVIITVYRDSVTKTADNAWRAVDARDDSLIWDITSKIVTEDLVWVELLATQRIGDDE